MAETKETYRLIKTANIIPSKDNPRIINEKCSDYLELVKSIKALGVIVPVHVRNHTEKGKYDLLAGERRVRAAMVAGRLEVRAINHGTISDDEAFEITFVENFGRADLTPLEQGKVVAILMGKYKGDTKAVAAKIGKSIRWVLQRAAIDKNLSKPWKVAITEDTKFTQWTAAHLQLIAAFPVDVQTKVLNEYEYGYFDEEIPTVQTLEKDLVDRMRVLSKALWDINDTTLVKGIKACSKCNKRSSSQPGLFDDTTDIEAVMKNDRCLDADCWQNKTQAHLELKAAELRAKHRNLVYAAMPDARPTWNERQELISKFGNVAFEWKASQEGAKDAVPALIVYGGQIGTSRWIKLTHSQVAGPGGTRKTGKPTPLKERRVLLEKKRWFVTIRNLIEKVSKSKVDEIVSKDRILTVMAVAVTFGVKDEYAKSELTTRRSHEQGTWKSFLKKTNKKEVLKELWDSARKTVCDDLTYCGAITQTSDELIEDAKCVAKLLGIDIKAMFDEVAKSTYPEPKSWQGLNADGTPKETKKKKAKNKKTTKTKTKVKKTKKVKAKRKKKK